MPDLIATTNLLEGLEHPLSGDAPALKTSKNLWFSDIAKGNIFSGYKKRLVAWNGIDRPKYSDQIKSRFFLCFRKHILS